MLLVSAIQLFGTALFGYMLNIVGLTVSEIKYIIILYLVLKIRSFKIIYLLYINYRIIIKLVGNYVRNLNKILSRINP